MDKGEKGERECPSPTWGLELLFSSAKYLGETLKRHPNVGAKSR